MAPNGCSEIVDEYCGPRTGERIYVTADGRRWTSEVSPGISSFTAGTGRTIGYVRDNRMCSHPEPHK